MGRLRRLPGYLRVRRLGRAQTRSVGRVRQEIRIAPNQLTAKHVQTARTEQTGVWPGVTGVHGLFGPPVARKGERGPNREAARPSREEPSRSSLLPGKMAARNAKPAQLRAGLKPAVSGRWQLLRMPVRSRSPHPTPSPNPTLGPVATPVD
jgi:hypothetical protein